MFLGGAGVVFQVNVDVVVATIGGGDFGNGAIHFTRLKAFGRNANYAAFGRWFGLRAFADVNTMCPSVHAIDDQVMPVVDLIGRPARHHKPGDGLGIRIGGIMDRVIRRTVGNVLARHFPVHGLDDVAALAQASQRVLQTLLQSLLTGPQFLGQAQPLQLLQAARTQALPEGVAAGCGDKARFIRIAD